MAKPNITAARLDDIIKSRAVDGQLYVEVWRRCEEGVEGSVLIPINPTIAAYRMLVNIMWSLVQRKGPCTFYLLKPHEVDGWAPLEYSSEILLIY